MILYKNTDKIMKKLIAGNWKMNGTMQSGTDLVQVIGQALKNAPDIQDACDILVCPPAIYASSIKEKCAEHNIALGAQDCSTHEQGAYTGDISAQMIRDCGGTFVIVGHSERRQYHNETDSIIAQKAKAAHQSGLVTIICVGETEEQRESGREEEIVYTQLINAIPDSADEHNTVIAYEPVWAIGTGKTASVEDVAKMHSFIREKLKERLAQSENIRILYGGSMKPENAKDLLSTPNVDGGLIGGASLKADQFIAIGRAAL